MNDTIPEYADAAAGRWWSRRRIVGITTLALLGTGLVAAASPKFTAWIGRNVEDPPAALAWVGSVALWGVAVALGLMVRRRGRAEGRWRTAGTLALLTTATASGVVVGLIVVVPYAAVWFGVSDLAISLPVFYGELPTADYGVIALAGSLATAGAFCLGALTWRLGARARHGVAAWLLVLPVCVYLARDDAEWRDVIELAEFAPPQVDAVVAGEILLRYAAGGELAQAFKEPELFRGKRVPAVASRDWVEWVAENRGGVAEVWAELHPVRFWWAEWNRYPAVADPTVSWESKLPSYKLIGTYARVVCAEATARASEGRGDEAVELLIPLFEGAGKLQAHSIALVRGMIAVAVRGMALDAAGLVLDRGDISPNAREKLRVAAARTLGGEAGIRRMVSGSFALQLEVFRQMEIATSKHPLGWMSALMFNPRRTHNEISDLVAELMELAARRNDAAMNGVWKRLVDRSRKRSIVKNQSSRSFFEVMIPDYAKFVSNYWAKEDATAALLARLAGSDGAVTPNKEVQP